MTVKDNRYAVERGLHKDGENDASLYRNENEQIYADSARPPYPGTESAGPALYDLVDRTARALEVQSRLLRDAIPLLNRRIMVEYKTGQTDANGNADIVLYQIPAGMQFIVTRVNVEAAGFNAGTPFSAAGAWIALTRSQTFAVGTTLDFLPNPPNAGATPILPASISDGATEAGVFRGGEFAVLHIVGTATLANVDIWARLQGIQEPI